ncbi:MAG: DNA polymerase III subunit alpha [Nevskiaceae bacterium]|nr:MAG: DNA polymerase III subunit alpha [Nevskiaceae bacterium]TAM26024.1 MAG: DNA polymerase III subunit alpha [Nevskiaceae bacterium]
MSFVHLRVHTEYSLTDGIVRVEPPKRKGGGQGATLTSAAKDLQLPALAITDRNNLFAMVKFYKAAEGAGIKPIAGADVLIEERLKDEGAERLTLLVQSEAGYLNLAALLSRAYAEGQGREGAVIKRAWLDERSEGLIALTGRDGSLAKALLGDALETAEAIRAEWLARFPGRLYLEVTRCGRPGEEDWVELAALYSRYSGLPLVATNDVRFLKREDFEAHEARVCIATGRMLADDKRPRDYSEEQYLKSAEEMQALFADLPEAIENSLEIARRCTLSLKFGTYHLPNFPVPEGHTPDSFLEQEAKKGLEWRLSQIQPARPLQEYRDRLDFEIGIIKKMGFAGYFLTVSDFIQWAKDNGCPVGPGRGSGAGSLVAYSLKITDLDPLPYDLLFERFLNPERVSMPDFDVDFCMDNRDRVIKYVAEKYGREYVGQIVTYATMAARGVVRDVTRIMGHGFGFGDRLAKLIPGIPGATLADAIEENPELKKAYEEEEDVRAVLDLALALEGVTRGVGVHAGGVVIAPKPLSCYTPLYCEADGSGVRTQFDMKDLETIGLVKFDFLGLKTLTIIQEAVDTIARLHGKQLDMLALPLDDQITYRKVYQSGDSSAVFQMESPGMQKASRDLKPDCFEDIIALVSLYRPGPMENIPEFCARKRGEIKVEYLHPEMEPVLKPTYGIFVYQEQVMQMSQRLAGYSLGGADLLRRAMGKKIRAEMEKQREIFTTGAIGRGVDTEVASKVFDLMAKFADYGFNKSHAAAYALVSYHTAWLKAHYPAEFMAAVMSCEMAHTETVVVMREEALRMGLKVLPPDVNRSRYRFTVPGPNAVLYGLGAIKGVGEGAVEGIVAERDANGPYKDLFDFCRRIDTKRCNKKVMEALVYSGALDGFGLNRASLIKTLPKALQLAERAAASASSGQNELFGLGSPQPKISERVQADQVQDWGLGERLQHEIETLGFYLSGHPMDTSRELIDQICSARLADLLANLPKPVKGNDGKPKWQPRTKQLFAAWVTEIRFFKPKEEGGRASYKVNLSDADRSIAVWIDADKWPKYAGFLKADSLVFVLSELGWTQPKDDRPEEQRLFNADFFAPGTVMNEYAQRISLRWLRRPAAEVQALKTLLQPYKDPLGVPVTVEYLGAGASAVLEFPPDWRLKADGQCLAALQQFLPGDCVKVQYRRYVPPVQERRFERSFAGGGGDDE